MSLYNPYSYEQRSWLCQKLKEKVDDKHVKVSMEDYGGMHIVRFEFH